MPAYREILFTSKLTASILRLRWNYKNDTLERDSGADRKLVETNGLFVRRRVVVTRVVHSELDTSRVADKFTPGEPKI